MGEARSTNGKEDDDDDERMHNIDVKARRK
jgi:hypothetical protein